MVAGTGEHDGLQADGGTLGTGIKMRRYSNLKQERRQGNGLQNGLQME
jgi:hypothetical protein